MEKRFSKTLDKRTTFTATALMRDGRYFSLTAEETEGREVVCGGCMHEDIRKHFPELSRFIPWHLADKTGTPMHYQENAKYWAGFSGFCDGKPSSPPNLDYLKSAIVFGRLPQDTEESLREALRDSDHLKAWLDSRLPDLRAAFHADMKELFGEEYTR